MTQAGANAKKKQPRRPGDLLLDRYFPDADYQRDLARRIGHPTLPSPRLQIGVIRNSVRSIFMASRSTSAQLKQAEPQ